MNLKIWLQPERGKRYLGRCQNRFIELQSAFYGDSWWVRFTNMNGERMSFVSSLSANFLTNYLADDAKYDLSLVSWCDTLVAPCSYNPFMGKRATAEHASNVYFMHNTETDLIKIGYSRYISDRHRQLEKQTGASLVLLGLIEGARDLEQTIHSHLVDFRRGGEWFHNCQKVKDFIAESTYLPDIS